MGNLSECIMDMRAEKRSASLLSKSLNTGALEQMDEDGDGVSDVSTSVRAVCHCREGLSGLLPFQGEFLATMLIAEGLCTRRDCNRYLKRFKELDADGSGKLDSEDIKQIAQREREREEHIGGLATQTPTPAR